MSNARLRAGWDREKNTGIAGAGRVWDEMQQHGTKDRKQQRMVAEAGVFAVLVVVFWGVDTLTKRNLRMVSGVGPDDFRLYVEQITSGLTVWLLVPAVAWWLRRFPLARGQLVSGIVGHVIGSGLFAALHYFIMTGMRSTIHLAFGSQYVFSDLWLRNLVIEWQKDLKIYVAIVAILMAFRYLWRSESATAVDSSERMAVQSGSGDHLVSYEDIEYLEASRNYVSVHTKEREYLVRQTIANLEQELAERRFIRTHRSFIVNQDHVTGIEPTAGGHELVLASGRRVPLSRGRRNEVRERLAL